MLNESHVLSSDHTATMRIIDQGESAQMFAGPKFAAAAEELREMGIARITRRGCARFYTLTPEGSKLLATLGDARIGGAL